VYRAAIVQLSSGADVEANWRSAEALVRAAAAEGARFIATPENTPFLGPHVEKVRRAEPLDGPTCRRAAELAAELGLFLLLGSFAERSEDPERCYNTSVLFGPDGGRRAAYRKIHLFDVDVSPQVRFQESATVLPGADAVVADTEIGRVGMSICYDLRFPGLYQNLRHQGADLITIPSAFTAVTGRDHWHVLVRARAIETQCYVLAPAQQGRHDDEGLRESYGHSLIVDPWGVVIAEAEAEAPGFVAADIDPERTARVRRQIPAAEHARFRSEIREAGPEHRPVSG
jgi:predicted amidohydrolase